MSKVFSFLFFIVVFVTSFNAQEEFELNVDFASFYVTDSISRVEVYYSFPQDFMKSYIDEEDSQEKVKGDLLVNILDLDTEQILLNKNWSFDYGIDTTKKDITGLLKFRLNPGNYQFTLIGKDLTDQSIVDTSKFQTKITKRPTKRFSISDIQVATSITKSSNKNSLFWKNTYEVVPYPSSLFGSKIGKPVLFFYSEFYNINKKEKPGKLKVEHYLFDANNNQKYRKAKFIPRKNNSVVDVGLINITDYHSGIYSLVVAIADTVREDAVKSTKKVYIYNPDVKDTMMVDKGANKFLTSEFAVMSKKELNRAFEKVTYIASQSEKSRWDDLNGKEAKRKFLYDFWERRDTVRTTRRNEFKKIYYKRIEQASRKFGKYREGWKTDKGRVYVLYGAPADIERHPNVRNTVPYEIWHYDNIEGGVKFVFADFSGLDSYRLIHSDKRGELTNFNWKQEIRR